MSDYTPTTSDIEDAWCSRYDGEHTGASGEELRGYEAEFARWLATVKADALREAADKLDRKYQPADVDEWGPHIGFYGESDWLCELANEIEQETDQ